jgi:4,5-DOPA dioxygenase extradiol
VVGPRARVSGRRHPVLQLSISETKGADFHFDLGARLAPLRDRDVLVIGSGNVVHNLRAIDWKKEDVGFDGPHRFDDAARTAFSGRPSEVVALTKHPDFSRASSTPDHFYPLLYLAGLAAAAARPAKALVDGYAARSP